MRTVTVEAYHYADLSEAAKGKARDWARDHALDFDWWDCIYEDAKRMFAFLGFTVDGIYFELYGQRAGACFNGRWDADKCDLQGVKVEAPQETDLHKAADDIAKLLDRIPPDVLEQTPSVLITTSGNCCNPFSMHLTSDLPAPCEDELFDIIRSLCGWLYRCLQSECEYRTGDAAVIEDIEANEWEFTKSGKPFPSFA